MTKKHGRPPLSEIASINKEHNNNTINHEWSRPERLLAALQLGPGSTLDAALGMNILHPAGAFRELCLRSHNMVAILQPATLLDGRQTIIDEYHLLPGGVSLADLLNGAGEVW